MAISQAGVPASAGAIYTSSGSTVAVTIYFCNYDVVDRTFSVWVVPSGGSVNDGTIIYKDLPIQTTDTYIIDLEKLLLDNGDAIFAEADAASALTATISHIGV